MWDFNELYEWTNTNLANVEIPSTLSSDIVNTLVDYANVEPNDFAKDYNESTKLPDPNITKNILQLHGAIETRFKYSGVATRIDYKQAIVSKPYYRAGGDGEACIDVILVYPNHFVKCYHVNLNDELTEITDITIYAKTLYSSLYYQPHAYMYKTGSSVMVELDELITLMLSGVNIDNVAKEAQEEPIGFEPIAPPAE